MCLLRSDKAGLMDECTVEVRLFILNKWSMNGPLEKVMRGQGFKWNEPSTDSEKQVFQRKGLAR